MWFPWRAESRSLSWPDAGWLQAVAEQLPLLPPLVMPVQGRGEGLSVGAGAGNWLEPGMDAEESRLYQPGDPVRLINWRVMARTDEAWVKYAPKPVEQRVLLVVDVQHSMWQGTGKRLKVAQAVAAAFRLAHACLGSAIVDTRLWGREPMALPVLRGRARWGVWQAQWLEGLTSMRACLQEQGAVVPLVEALLDRSHQLLILVSDLRQWDEAMQLQLADWRAQGREVLLVHVLDRQEVFVPMIAGVGVQGESGVQLPRSEALVQWQARMAAWRHELLAWSAAMGVHYWPWWADADWSSLGEQHGWE